MILSHKYKFIFIKTNKTAGTSIEIAFSKICGDKDIITPITKEDEKKRRELNYKTKQNYLASISEYNFVDILKLIFLFKKKKRFYNHISAQEIKDRVEKNIWENYYKFTVERNPWDRVTSLYYWRFKNRAKPPFKEFIESEIPSILKQRGIQLYTIDGKIVVDRICKFEQLEEDIEKIRQDLGINEDLELPKAKGKTRKTGVTYQDLFNEETKNIIYRKFKEEIEYLGYNF
jgi:hypothetical protein